jgi:tetratricopeptide (TPR) repeat protein
LKAASNWFQSKKDLVAAKMTEPISGEHNMAARLRQVGLFAAIAVLTVAGTTSAWSQDPQNQNPPPPSDPANPAAPAPKNARKTTDSATTSAPDQPTWDPLRADRDMQVAEYYLHKGDIDAAIDRFQDAILAKPGYGLPFRFLGEAQEKKGYKKPAIKSYQRYLDLMPKADDAEKIKKKIEKLYKETGKDKERN